MSLEMTAKCIQASGRPWLPPSEAGTRQGKWLSLSSLHMRRARPSCRRLLTQAMRLPRSLALASAGSSMLARMPMMAMTTRSSMRVNALGRADSDADRCMANDKREAFGTQPHRCGVAATLRSRDDFLNGSENHPDAQSPVLSSCDLTVAATPEPRAQATVRPSGLTLVPGLDAQAQFVLWQGVGLDRGFIGSARSELGPARLRDSLALKPNQRQAEHLPLESVAGRNRFGDAGIVGDRLRGFEGLVLLLVERFVRHSLERRQPDASRRVAA